MAFEVAKTGYQQISPTFNPGYPYEKRYHNVGQLMTPYQGKPFGTGGDYGPPQSTRYYTVENPNYPYVMDSQLHATQYIPGNGCCYPPNPSYSPCVETQYPDKYIPGNYFSPQIHVQSGLSDPIDPYPARPVSGTPTPFGIGVRPAVAPNKNLGVPNPELEYKWSPDKYEEYDGDNSVEAWDYGKLRVTGNRLRGYKNFYPFNDHH